MKSLPILPIKNLVNLLIATTRTIYLFTEKFLPRQHLMSLTAYSKYSDMVGLWGEGKEVDGQNK